MSADIVERLRQDSIVDPDRTMRTMEEAADEIERLRHELTLMRVAENGRLVFATEEIERLRAEKERGANLFADQREDLRALRAENGRLRDPGQSSERYWEGRFRDEKAENDRLRARVAELEIVS